MLAALAVALAAGGAGAQQGRGVDWTLLTEVFEEICRQGILHPQIVMRQAILETGWLRPGMLMRQNNLFGFQVHSYMSFPHWRDSVEYYKAWQARSYRNRGEDYYAFLDRIRYGAPGYSAVLRQVNWDRSCPVP